MKKRILTLIVCMALILGIVPFSLSANVALPDTVIGVGNKVVALEADVTNDALPAVFGTKEGNGIVWTNKNVAVKDGQFEVTLSALAQEYASSAESEEVNSTPADVVMILDVSGSMRNNKLTLDGDTNATRTKAMVKAVNEAMEVIMSANPLNRVMIYTFHTDNDINTLCNELLPLGHYTNPSWTDESVWSSTSTNAAIGKYFDYSVQTSGSGYNKTTSDKIATASGLLKDGDSLSGSVTTSSGTCTQQGIITGVKALSDIISAEEKTVERLPFVFLFTDGAPGAASKNWYSETPTDKNQTSHYNNGNSEVTALTILSAAIEKDRLSAAYSEYNGKETEANWFNLGLTVGDSVQGNAFLNPVTVKDGTNDAADEISEYISDYTSGDYANYSSYANDYVYAQDNVVFASTGTELTGAFGEFANLIKESSKEIKLPIVTPEVSTAAAELVFSEVISNGMAVDSIALQKDNNTTIIGTPTSDGNNTVYSFEGMETTVAVSKNNYGETLLTWNIPSKEVAMYTFADHSDIDNGQYIQADPIRLIYDVSIANEEGLEDDRLYVNSFTEAKDSLSGKNEASSTVSFTVASDNPYYYEVTTDDNGVFVSSTIKDNVFDTVNKDKNISGTADYSSKTSYNLGNEKTNVTTLLGNNGIAFAVVMLEKKASNDKVNAGDTLSFTVTVTNLYNDKITNVLVKDTLPQGLTFISSDANGVIVENSDNVLTLNITSLEAGESVEITYNVKVDSVAATGTVYENKAIVNSVSNTNVSNPATSTAEIEVINKFKVIYKWDGEIPTTVVLPNDSNTYVPGESYVVDTNYQNGHRIETKDSYGNVNGYYLFSGWTDPGNGVMGYADIEITGLWTYQGVDVPAHKVIYSWSGDLPSNETLPNDKNLYVKGQNYTIDGKYTANMRINTFDNYGNLSGYYSFSGWNDAQNGVMGDGDVTVTGVWTYTTQVIPSYKVHYDWGSTFPDGVTLPQDSNSYVSNQPYEVDGEYTAQSVIDTFDKYGNKNGEWRFSGWTDPKNGVMGNTDITVTGKWTYTEQAVPTHKVIYDWGTEYPNGAVLPFDLNEYVKNQGYEIDIRYTAQSVIDTFDKYGNKNGEWRFSGWTDPKNGVMGNTDVTVTGKWTHTPITVPAHKVIYSWTGAIPENVVLPVDQNTYVKGESYTVDTTFTAGKAIEIKDQYGNLTGVYTFLGWNDPKSGTMGESDITVIGEWVYRAIDQNKYTVTYYWGETAPNSAKLPVDLNSYVENQPYSVDTVYTDKTVVYSYDQKGNTNGLWRFSGWEDTVGGVMGKGNVIIKGQWQFTKTEIPEHKVDFDKDTKTIEKLEKIKVYPNGGVWQYGGKTYKDDQSAVIVVDGDIEIPDPTRENFTYEGWEVLEEDGFVLVLRAKWMPPVPTTGDNSNIVTVAVIAAIALVSLIGLAVIIKRKK